MAKTTVKANKEKENCTGVFIYVYLVHGIDSLLTSPGASKLLESAKLGEMAAAKTVTRKTKEENVEV